MSLASHIYSEPLGSCMQYGKSILTRCNGAFRRLKLGSGWIQPGLAALAVVITGYPSSPRRVSTLSTVASELSRRHSVIKCRVVFALNQHRMKQELKVTARRFTVLADEDSVYTVPWRCALAGTGQREQGRERNGYMYWK